MADVMMLFRVILIVNLVYAFGITGITYALPNDAAVFTESFSELDEQINLQGTSNKIQDSLESQTNIPVIDLGALVFYSGNLVIDLLLNFAFAIPQLIATLINSLFFFFNLDVEIFALLQLLTSALILSLYFLSLIQLIVGIRSGRIV